MRHNPFRGFGIAVATPFDKEGHVELNTLRTLVLDQLAAGADFLCVLGTTAETPTLSDTEKIAIRKTVQGTAGKDIPLLLGCGTNNTAEVCHFLKTEDLSGFDGILVVCPFYNKPTQEGLYQHFKAISEASPLPIVLYNVPGRTGVNLTAQTTLRIAQDCENVVAIKEASGKIDQIEDIVDNAPEGFDVLSGDDSITFELMTVGAKGVISVIGNAYPKEFGDMIHHTQKGEYTEALKLHRKFNEFYKLMSINGNPSGIKCLLKTLDKAENILRLPLVPVTEETEKRIKLLAANFKVEQL